MHLLDATATKITQTGFYQKIFKSINHYFFASYGMHAMKIILCFWGFLCFRDAGRRGNKICESVHVRYMCAFEQDMLFPEENYSLYFVASYRPHLSHFWANVIFTIPT